MPACEVGLPRHLHRGHDGVGIAMVIVMTVVVMMVIIMTMKKNNDYDSWQQHAVYRKDAPFDDNFEDVCADDVYDGDGDNMDDADHLLVEVDGPEPSGCGNDAEQVENPVQLNF